MSKMFERNLDVRAARGKIPKWVIAELLGVHENTLNGWMRKEMDDERKRIVLQAIAEVKAEIKEQGVTS